MSCPFRTRLIGLVFVGLRAALLHVDLRILAKFGCALSRERAFAVMVA